jgi:protein-S-isoprenylcysteine O-methyltransferase Ste14
MRRIFAILASLVFLVFAAGFVAGVVPWWITSWVFPPSFLRFALFRFVGVVLIVAGAPIILDSFARFAIQGLGTPTPILPAPCRDRTLSACAQPYVRWSNGCNSWAGACCSAVSVGSATGRRFGWLFLFVVLYEEPTLRHTFGEEYNIFCQNVPRWIPRTHPRHT